MTVEMFFVLFIWAECTYYNIFNFQLPIFNDCVYFYRLLRRFAPRNDEELECGSGGISNLVFVGTGRLGSIDGNFVTHIDDVSTGNGAV
jgi:hypothetical protein